MPHAAHQHDLNGGPHVPMIVAPQHETCEATKGIQPFIPGPNLHPTHVTLAYRSCRPGRSGSRVPCTSYARALSDPACGMLLHSLPPLLACHVPIPITHGAPDL